MSMNTTTSRTLAISLLTLAIGAQAHAQHAGHAQPQPVAQEQDEHDEHAAHAAPAKQATETDAHAGMDHAQHGASTPPAAPVDHSRMDHATMDHSQMDHSKMDHPEADQAPVDHSKMNHSGMDPAQMGHGQAAASEPREPIPPLTDADRAAAFPVLAPHAMEHPPAINRYVLFNRLETWDADRGSGQAWEGSAWIGSDLNRLWLRSEGERVDGRSESIELEALYGRSISPWWDLLAGVKHDFRPADSRSWAAIGVQGMAPYKFEVAATAYFGESGQVAATLEAEYDVLLTNRLILQPLVEARFSARDEPEYGNGSGLNTVEAGLRLRYEFSRRFAPYIGVVHERAFGDTADHRREEGESPRDTRFVAGVRVWF